ncbi:hypothetical protein HaLaN_26806 [Haematococcus lacustris]|uniref:Uncharacterized protein n=1 Tax=Haematococcus lacustris TaxID=44745 RepID=A0A6A0A748_HAELA|nr:hypothetical protein HaLaN_26806 [Haematococcus lacustris]
MKSSKALGATDTTGLGGNNPCWAGAGQTVPRRPWELFHIGLTPARVGAQGECSWAAVLRLVPSGAVPWHEGPTACALGVQPHPLVAYGTKKL